MLVEGGTTNKSFLLALLALLALLEASADTGWVDRSLESGALTSPRHTAIALAVAAIDGYDRAERDARARLWESGRTGRPHVRHDVGRGVDLKMGGARLPRDGRADRCRRVPGPRPRSEALAGVRRAADPHQRHPQSDHIRRQHISDHQRDAGEPGTARTAPFPSSCSPTPGRIARRELLALRDRHGHQAGSRRSEYAALVSTDPARDPSTSTRRIGRCITRAPPRSRASAEASTAPARHRGAKGKTCCGPQDHGMLDDHVHLAARGGSAFDESGAATDSVAWEEHAGGNLDDRHCGSSVGFARVRI